jgi:N-acetylmuramoyl-L-alanine amidase
MLKFIRRILVFLGLISEDKTPPTPAPEPPTVDPEEPAEDIAQDGADASSEEDAPITITDEEDIKDVFPKEDPPKEEGSEHQPRFLWLLDNGHGKLTSGKRSPLFDDGVTRLLEYEFNRDVVQRIMARLDEIGVQYVDLVPEVETVGDFLEERVKRANAAPSNLPRLFVSVHSNAAPAPSGKWAAPHISGIETWCFHTSSTGRQLAGVFQRRLIEEMGWRNRHIKSRPTRQFYVLKKTVMPAILTENGFFNNKQQAIELMKPSVRQRIAEAHVRAILELERNGF